MCLKAGGGGSAGRAQSPHAVNDTLSLDLSRGECPTDLKQGHVSGVERSPGTRWEGRAKTVNRRR